MANTESTAINDLIDLVQGKKPAPQSDPGGDDLFAGMHPPRMTSTIPPTRGAGDIAPLPRARAPQATSEQPIPGDSRPSGAALATEAPRMRMRSASPERGTTIPPLARHSAPAGTMPPPSRTSTPPGTPKIPAALRDSIQARMTVPSGPIPQPSRTNMPQGAPVAAPFLAPTPQEFPVVATRQPFPLITPDASDDPWAESRPGIEKVSETRALIKKLIAPALLVIAGGIVVGAVIASGRKHETKPTAATPPPTATAPRAAESELVVRPSQPRTESDNAATASAGGAQPEPPTKAEQAADVAAAMTHEAPKDAVDSRTAHNVREVQTTNGVVKFVDVRIDSDPAGATITLVDGGKQSFLGTTPLATSVDPSREYDVIVAIDGRPTRMVHLNPATMSRLDVSLGRKSRTARPAKAPSTPATKAESAPAAASVGDSSAQAMVKMGTLMVSSKPPCEIYVDGEATGLTTPQRAIELPAGTHDIMLKNDDANVKKTVSVKITAGEVTKLIQDLMSEQQ